MTDRTLSPENRPLKNAGQKAPWPPPVRAVALTAGAAALLVAAATSAQATPVRQGPTEADRPPFRWGDKVGSNGTARARP